MLLKHNIKTFLEFESVRVFFEKGVYILFLFSVAFFIPLYEVSTVTLSLAGIISFVLILTSVRRYISGLQFLDYYCLIVFLIFPFSFFLAFFLNGSDYDYKAGVVDLRVAFLFYMIVICLRSYDGWRNEHFVAALAVMTILAGGIGVLKGVVTSDRVTVGTHFINMYAIVMCVSSLYLLSVALFEDIGLKKLFLFISSIFGAFGVFLSGSRGALIVLLLIAFVLCFIYLYSRRQSLLLFYRQIFFVVLVVVGSGFIGSVVHIDRYIKGYNNAMLYSNGEEKGKVTSIGLRIEMWRASFVSIDKQPLIGVGSGRLGDIYSDEIENGLISQHISKFVHHHNDILQSLSSRGLIGLISYFLLITLPISLFLLKSRKFNLSGVVSLTVSLSYILAGLYSSAIHITIGYVFFMLLSSFFVLSSARGCAYARN